MVCKGNGVRAKQNQTMKSLVKKFDLFPEGDGEPWIPFKQRHDMVRDVFYLILFIYLYF